MKNINDIFEMLDLFYANIHLYKKLRKDKEHGCVEFCSK